jgi:hypothetical protein
LERGQERKYALSADSAMSNPPAGKGAGAPGEGVGLCRLIFKAENTDTVLPTVRMFAAFRRAYGKWVMALSLNMLSTSVQWCMLRKGPRIFALLGKATPLGLACFRREDVSNGWAVTAEFGCLRIERLCGDEEVSGDGLFLPTPLSYQYGVTGLDDSPVMTRAVFGLLPNELEQLVDVLRRGSFPMLGFSMTDQKCSVSSSIIPGYWPHVVTSNLALYGNVVSLESFMRILVSSLPQGALSVRFPSLQPVFKHLMRLVVVNRRGLPYTKELLELLAKPALAVK